jgi:hypothetical protein
MSFKTLLQVARMMTVLEGQDWFAKDDVSNASLTRKDRF